MTREATQQAEQLERAILARAERLAAEYRERGSAQRDRILREAAERLRLREQREEAIAKALGERAYRQQVQAEELKLQSHLDRVRWNLVGNVEARLAERFQAHVEDRAAYGKTLLAWVAAAAREIEREVVHIRANARDLKLLAAHQADLDAVAADLGKTLRLDDEPIETLGGVVAVGDDKRIRVDNSFEGRMARLRERVQQRILERLVPSGFDTGSIFGG